MKDRPFINLLEECFSGIIRQIECAQELGFVWSSKAFLKYAEGEVISHVGLLDYPIFIDGHVRKIAALHAICTKQSYRAQGFAAELIQEALKWAESRYESVVLYTEIPAFYERFSFRVIQESRFHLKLRHEVEDQALFPLSFPKNNALFVRCFSQRTSLSNHVWMADNGSIASFNALYATYPNFWSLFYSPSLDCILSFEVKEKTLHLYDVIASEIPSLEAILSHIPSTIEEIYFYFFSRPIDSASNF